MNSFRSGHSGGQQEISMPSCWVNSAAFYLLSSWNRVRDLIWVLGSYNQYLKYFINCVIGSYLLKIYEHEWEFMITWKQKFELKITLRFIYILTIFNNMNYFSDVIRIYEFINYSLVLYIKFEIKYFSMDPKKNVISSSELKLFFHLFLRVNSWEVSHSGRTVDRIIIILTI